MANCQTTQVVHCDGKMREMLFIAVWKCLTFKPRIMLYNKTHKSKFLYNIVSSQNLLCEICKEFAEKELRGYS